MSPMKNKNDDDDNEDNDASVDRDQQRAQRTRPNTNKFTVPLQKKRSQANDKTRLRSGT
jgi:hypothetical protein